MAIAAARLGARVGYVTRLGDDAFGRRFLDLWAAEGVDMRGVAIDAEAPTGVYFVTHGAHGHEFSYLRAGSAASRMRPETLPHDVVRAARLLHVSGISQAISASACDTVFAAIDIARAAGAMVLYDPNLRLKLWPLPRARATILATMALCNWCVPSLDDARVLFDGGDAAAIVAACHRAGAPGVVLKLGADGCVVSDGTRQEHVPAHRVTPRRCDRRRRLLRRRLRHAAPGRRRSVHRGGLRQRRGRARDDGVRRGGAVAARCRRARRHATRARARDRARRSIRTSSRARSRSSSAARPASARRSPMRSPRWVRSSP